MPTYTLYNAETGELVARIICARKHIDLNIATWSRLHDKPLAAHEGDLDMDTQRIDVLTGEPVEHQSAVLVAEMVSKSAVVAAARSQLQALDYSELRAISDVLMDPLSTEAMERLANVRALKEAQREILNN